MGIPILSSESCYAALISVLRVMRVLFMIEILPFQSFFGCFHHFSTDAAVQFTLNTIHTSHKHHIIQERTETYQLYNHFYVTICLQ